MSTHQGAGGIKARGWFIWAALVLFALSSWLAFTQAPGRVEGPQGVWDWLRNPIEINAKGRIPRVNVDLFDVDMVDDGRAIVVGASGMILTSEDYGATWARREIGVVGDLRSVAMLPDGRAIAVGYTTPPDLDGGSLIAPAEDYVTPTVEAAADMVAADDTQPLILVSDDYGANWTQVEVDLAATKTEEGGEYSLEDVAMHADGHAIIVGAQGLVLTSDDAGKNWVPYKTTSEYGFLSVVMGANGGAVAANFIEGLYISSDRGKSWELMPAQNESETVDSIAIADDDNIIVTMGSDRPYFSNDNGQNWSRKMAIKDVALSAVTMLSDGRTIALTQDSFEDGSQNHRIAISNNKGDSWTLVSSGITQSLYAVKMTESGRAIAVGGAGTIVTSGDDGRSWRRASNLYGTGISDVAINDNGTIVATTTTGEILSSQNAGKHWALRRVSPDGPLGDVTLNNDGAVLARNENGRLFRSADAGQTWTKRNLKMGNPFIELALTSDGRAIALDGMGNAYTSDDAGTSWRKQSWAKAENDSIAIYDTLAVSDSGRAIVIGNFLGDYGLATSGDFGKTWQAQDIPAAFKKSIWLSSLAFASDGRAIAIASSDSSKGDRFALSTDNGQKWQLAPEGQFYDAQDVALQPEGRAIAVGGFATSKSLIWTSADGGQSWTPRPVMNRGPLSSVAMNAKGQAVAVGANDKWTIFLSDDFGETWRAIANPTPFARYPAPWYGLAVLAVLALLWLALRGAAAVKEEQEGANAIAASDAPATSWRQDRLQFVPLARGISRFLRNANTTPPLTVAINGEWGTGKSSLMSLICEDMRAYGWRPIWFNAWHHQKEDQLLPALLDALKVNGLPPTLSFAGIAYRSRLLWMRSKNHYLFTVMLLAMLAAIVGLQFSALGQMSLGTVEDFLARILRGDFEFMPHNDKVAIPTFLAYIATIGGIIVTLKNALSSFGMDPAVLLTSYLDKARLKNVRQLTSFRTQFAREFDEVTRALEFPPVIVIDDLDRCSPDTVLDIMESVNFLTSSGRCFVIFGMARERVQASLALSFTNIARELAEFDIAAQDGELHADAERQKRRRYAQDYLEKLINIDILVPNRADIAAYALLDGRTVEGEGKAMRRFVARARPLVAIGALALAMGLAFNWGYRQPEAQAVEDKDAKAEQSKTLLVEMATSSARWKISMESANGAILESTKSAANESKKQPNGPKKAGGKDTETPKGPEFAAGATDGVSAWWWLSGMALAMALGMTAFLIIRRLRMQAAVVKDSPAFNDALRIWSSIATLRRNSPRAIKRFGNRIRYLAMLQQGSQLDDTPWYEKAIARVTQWRRGKAGEAPAETQRLELALSEHRVVALGALQTYFQDDKWLSYASAPLDANFKTDQFGIPDQFARQFYDAVRAYEKATGAKWPPSKEEIAAFDRSLKGVRIAGEAKPIAVDDGPTENEPRSNAKSQKSVQAKPKA